MLLTDSGQDRAARSTMKFEIEIPGSDNSGPESSTGVDFKLLRAPLSGPPAAFLEMNVLVFPRQATMLSGTNREKKPIIVIF
jgi:hypothetical protein